MYDENKINENILKFYETKVEELNKLKNHLYTDIGLGPEDNLDLALRIFRTRYKLVVRPGKDDMVAVIQAEHTSNLCLEAIFGKVVNTAVIDLLEACDRLTSHVKALKELLHDKSAILINDYETIGRDDYPVVGIGRIINKHTPEFYTLSNAHEVDVFGDYIDSDWEPSDEKKEKCMEYWRSHGIL